MTARTATLPQRYAAYVDEHNVCPIEAGAIGRLADNECQHGRLAGDTTAACGCWPNENLPPAAPVLTLHHGDAEPTTGRDVLASIAPIADALPRIDADDPWHPTLTRIARAAGVTTRHLRGAS